MLDVFDCFLLPIIAVYFRRRKLQPFIENILAKIDSPYLAQLLFSGTKQDKSGLTDRMKTKLSSSLLMPYEISMLYYMKKFIHLLSWKKKYQVLISLFYGIKFYFTQVDGKILCAEYLSGNFAQL